MSSSDPSYCTCPHLDPSLISQAITLCQSHHSSNFPPSISTRCRHPSTSTTAPFSSHSSPRTLWICIHCHDNFHDFSAMKFHVQHTDHFLYLFYHSIRYELYCTLCSDYQYSSVFDQLTSLITPSPKIKHHRIIGFVNMGSTCFLSSVLQVLLSNPILIRFFDLSELFIHNCKAITKSSKQAQLCLFCELSKLFKMVNKYTWRTDGTEVAAAVPSQVLSAIWISSRHLAHYEQHDAHELLIALLDTLGSHLQFNHGDHNFIQLQPHSPKAEKEISKSEPLFRDQGICHSPRSWNEEIQESTQEVSHTINTGSAPPEANPEEEDQILPSTVASPMNQSTAGLNYVFRGIVNETFSGVLRSELTCHTCAHKRCKYEPFVDLSLSIEKKGSEVLPSEEREMAAPEGEAPPEVSPLPSETRQCSGRGRGKSREKKRKGSPLGVSLLDCLSGFTSLEHLQHSVECENCGVSGSSSKKLTIHVPPNCLIVHLKRFSGLDADPRASPLKSWEESQGECGKIDTPVTFPLTDLNILPFISPELQPTDPLPSISETEPSVPLPESIPPKPKRGRKRKNPLPSIKTEPEIAPPSSLLYDLCGLVSHKGESLSQGHYVSYVKAEDGWAQLLASDKKGGDGNSKEPNDLSASLPSDTPAKRRRASDQTETSHAEGAGPEKRGRGRPKSQPTIIPKPLDPPLFSPAHPSATWVKCDDEFVTPVDVSEMESIEGYILIYLRRDVSEKCRRGDL